MKNKLKIQIIGWLLLIVSMLVAGSMIGYDLTEEPSLVAQKINNPFNILGVYIGFYLMKLGFGYAALLFPVILATVSYYLISNFSFNLLKLLKFQLFLLVLFSITLSFFNNLSSLSELKLIEDFSLSGLIGGLLLGLIFDWFGFFGSILILFSSYVLIIVSFFEIDLFKKLKNLPKNLKGLIPTINFDFKKLIPDLTKKEEKKEKVKIIEDDSFLESINSEESLDPVVEEIKEESLTELQPDDEAQDEIITESQNNDSDIDNDLDSITIEKAVIEKEAEIDEQRNKSILKVAWKFPSTDILQSSDESSEINEDDIRERSELLKN